MKNINYEKAFKKLVEQIKIEKGFAQETKGSPYKTPEFNEANRLGMLFAYQSIEELADKLIEEGEEFFNNDLEEKDGE